MFTEGRGANALREEFEAWREHGATHCTVRTMTAGLGGVGAHLRAPDLEAGTPLRAELPLETRVELAGLDASILRDREHGSACIQ